MKLLTKQNLKDLPGLYSQEEKGVKAMAVVKFFDPCGSFTWYATEYDPIEETFFGFVDGPCPEYGYFSLSDLEGYKGPLGIGIERDLHFTPKTIGEIADEILQKQFA